MDEDERLAEELRKANPDMNEQPEAAIDSSHEFEEYRRGFQDAMDWTLRLWGEGKMESPKPLGFVLAPA